MMTDVAASARLRAGLDLLLPGMSRTGSRLWNHPDLANIYPRYMVAIHSMIRASVPLMEAALSVTRQAYVDMPGGRALEAYYAKHIPEEMWHDEWVLDDLERIGFARTIAIEHVPSPTVAAMVGSQYYYIRHVHPAVLLGYIGVLEGYPPAEELARTASEKTGYPIEAFRTLRKHAHLDPHHRDDLDAAYDAMPFGPELHALIRANAMRTLGYLVAMVEEILDDDASRRIAADVSPSSRI
jgi:hypothetical protein